MPDARRIEFSGALGLRDVHAVRDTLLEALGGQAAVEIDAGELTEIDVSIVQVLIAAQKTARARGTRFHVIASPEGPLRAVMFRAGLLQVSGEAPFEISWHRRNATP